MANFKSKYKKIDIFSEDQGIMLSSNDIRYEGNRLILSGDNLEVLPHMTMVQIIGYLEEGIVLMRGCITLSIPSQLNLDIHETFNIQERRKYLRVKTNYRTKILRAYSLGLRKKSIKINDPIIVKDISIGGLSIYSNRPFFVNQIVSIDLQELKNDFTPFVKVLRKQKLLNHHRYKYKYACQFLDLETEPQRVLCEYVFKVQIENYKKHQPGDM